MIKLLLLTMLLAGSVLAQGAPDETMAAAKQLEISTSFGIEVADGWVQKEVGELTSFYHPNGDGVLKIQSYSAPSVVDSVVLPGIEPYRR